MSRTVRLGLFAVSAAGLAALLLWGVAGLPDFGHYVGPYGYVLNAVAVNERHATNVVTATTFDYRGFDTLGEEFILFAAGLGVALLLRDVREGSERPVEGVLNDAVRLVGIAFVPALLAIGLFIVAHGLITPGGGFQGGVILASAFLLVWLAGEYRAFRKLTPEAGVDLAKGAGAGGYVVIGMAALLLGHAFLHVFGPLGTAGKLASGGSLLLLNIATALEVSAAFVLIFTEFLEELAARRLAGRG
ncbi:MAG TPA: hydrogen gas-evolving membrane-bound hydrogenase subunit E [Gaiellaceae bacterium]|nr:hydrogen gas-evolving membrane-bound hydrogenase subunit E [Gaiellaceae bacterium]